MSKRGKLFWLWALFVIPLRLLAADVTVQQAEQAAANWLGMDAALGCPLGRRVLSSHTCHTPQGTRFHVLRIVGGGFIVMTADTTEEPVVAFSTDDDLVADERNPLWALLCHDRDRLPQKANVASSSGVRLQSAAPSVAERKWARLLSGTEDRRRVGSIAAKAAARPSVSDLRVAPFVQSTWGQTTVGGENFYNACTPSNYYAGCVATAGAQIMRYLEWPRTAVSSFTNANCSVDGAPATLTAFGGVYNWEDMPLRPDASASERQKTAISRLVHDLGVACGMSYGASGSAVGSYMLVRAWTTCFGYASAMAYTLVGDLPAESVRRALISNFDARLPVVIGISGDSDGHAVVGDGYGYSDGTLYYHLNMGWDGNGNAWYAPPDLSAGGYSFSSFGSVVYNIFPELSAGHTICSGRVLDADGVPIAGATVSATDFWSEHYETSSDEHGVYALILPSTWAYPLPYTIHAEHNGESSDDLSVKVKMCISTLVNSDGTFNSNTAPAPAVNNLIDQNLTIHAISGVAPHGDPALEATRSTEVPVSFAWLKERYPETTDFEACAIMRGANGRPVWESYLLGLEPTNALSDLRITLFELGDNGVPFFGWNVTNELLQTLGYRYRIKGKTRLESDEPWSAPDATHCFFRLFVEKSQ